MTKDSFLTIKGRKVRVDETGRVCLNDIHRAGGFTKNQTPADWQPAATKLIAYTVEKTTGKSGVLSKEDINSVYCTRVGRNGGTWAHPNLALAYAKYLSPALHYDVNEVFLRYKAGDATLADETLQRSTPEGNEWAGTRALSRSTRVEYTDTLRDHGVKGPGYAQCTDAAYKELFDGTGKQLKKARNFHEKANLRDHMSTEELVYTMAAETLATGRIKEENSQGNGQCATATSRSASFIRKAIEADKADRQRRMI